MAGSVIEDVKKGIKGVHGAGEALRGEVLNATDRAFDGNNNHPQTVAAREKHSGIAAKGKQDIDTADEMIARRETERAGTAGKTVSAGPGLDKTAPGPESAHGV